MPAAAAFLLRRFFLCFYGIGGGIGVSILFKSLSKGFVVADAHSGPVFLGGNWW